MFNAAFITSPSGTPRGITGAGVVSLATGCFAALSHATSQPTGVSLFGKDQKPCNGAGANERHSSHVIEEPTTRHADSDRRRFCKSYDHFKHDEPPSSWKWVKKPKHLPVC